jgi:UDP-N-acetylmuramyl tripeptide synthase
VSVVGNEDREEIRGDKDDEDGGLLLDEDDGDDELLLDKALYEAMGVRTGMVGVLGTYAFGSNKLDAQPDASGDSIVVQKLMATMLHNGSKAVVLETTTDGISTLVVDSEVDYDIAMLTNIRHTNGEDGMT